jgi:hypothetical protein
VNGTPVGARDIFQLDQSVGLGSGFPIYNRFTAGGRGLHSSTFQLNLSRF